MRGVRKTQISWRSRLVLADDGLPDENASLWRQAGRRPGRRWRRGGVVSYRERGPRLDPQQRSRVRPQMSVIWCIDVRDGPVSLNMRSNGQDNAIDAAVVMVRMPWRTDLVEHQQQHKQPTNQRMRSQRARCEQDFDSVGGLKTHARSLTRSGYFDYNLRAISTRDRSTVAVLVMCVRKVGVIVAQRLVAMPVCVRNG